MKGQRLRAWSRSGAWVRLLRWCVPLLVAYLVWSAVGVRSVTGALLVWLPLAVLGFGLLGVRARREKVSTRLRMALAEEVGAAVTSRALMRRVRWRGTRPVRFEMRYPTTFKDDGEHQAEVEDALTRKTGRTWMARWDTQRDRVAFSSPDPLAVPTPTPWPHVDAARLSLWEPIPIGVDRAGRAVTVSLGERNMLLGGIAGSGKSNVLSMLVATACLDPSVTVHLADGKEVEMAAWEPCAHVDADGNRSVVTTLTELEALLDRLLGIMQMRYTALKLRTPPARKVERGMGPDYGLHVLVIDELADFTDGEKRVVEPVVRKLSEVLRKGRAAGIVVLAATQRPSADVIPTKVRDLIGFRCAMRCTNRISSDMVLGDWGRYGFSAHRISGDALGMGLLLAEGAEPVRFKSHYLGDADLARLAERAARLRAGSAGPVRVNGLRGGG
jgi:hypothetical protein